MPDELHTTDNDPRLDQIVSAILKIADMDFDTGLRPGPRRDEIDAIIMGINAMAAELKLTYSTLDRRVEDRTVMLEKARDQMELLAYTDPLTQLANRSALMRDIEIALKGMEEGGPAPILLLLDLDAFKSINDTHGHAVGDQVLRQLSARLRSGIRAQDLIARLGGDEFAILLCAQEHGAYELGQRIVSTVNEQMVVDGISLAPGASLGIAIAAAGYDADRLLLEADTAMYAAKHSRTSKVHEFEPYMLFERQEKAAMVADLRRALGTDQILPYYQSLVSLQDEAIVGAELLVRWERPDYGLTPPGEFLAVAEEAGMMGAITEQLLDEALKDLVRWRALGVADEAFTVHLNVSSRELHLLGFPDIIRDALRRHGLPASTLALEITEDKLMTGDRLHKYTMLALRQMGVEVYIDDFGTGYSSISYLRQLPVAGVKIDKSLVDDADTDPQQEKLLMAVAYLIEACALECVVEGVETRGQADKLRAMGFGHAQGYLFGRPMGSADFTAVLSARPRAKDSGAAGDPAKLGHGAG
ncbi:putative bifunctional diguanylate cyclase/phosphodiesterase [Paeniglutamicibacter sp. R2-26]|uniref:putative bifunctional diguanylate cyclase/phosphodiesterase n=1 Tax=Paeniglutamicibacter sp. R2-26 TaxID=3144417 RepID=UPI003EE77713